MLCAQSCPTLCDPMDCSPPGSSVMDFSRQEYWSGLPSPSPGALPDSGIEPASSGSPVGRWLLYHYTTWEALGGYTKMCSVLFWAQCPLLGSVPFGRTGTISLTMSGALSGRSG